MNRPPGALTSSVQLKTVPSNRVTLLCTLLKLRVILPGAGASGPPAAETPGPSPN